MNRANGRLATAAVIACFVCGCSSVNVDPKTGLYTQPIIGAPAVANVTPYTESLACLNSFALSAQKPRPRVAVGRIEDMSGKRDFYTGANISQGIALFAQSALARAGMPMVERIDREISDFELKAAMEHQLSDTPEKAGADPDNYREVYAGQIAGSDYYIVGGLTELNLNIESSGSDLKAGAPGEKTIGGAFLSRRFVMNIAMDLRLVDTRTQEIRSVTAYQKQLVGKEVKPSLFVMADGLTLDLSGGKSQMEPIQLGVRTLVERSVYDFAASLYGMDVSVCQSHTGKDSLNGPVNEPRPGYQGPFLNRSRWHATHHDTN